MALRLLVSLGLVFKATMELEVGRLEQGKLKHHKPHSSYQDLAI